MLKEINRITPNECNKIQNKKYNKFLKKKKWKKNTSYM